MKRIKILITLVVSCLILFSQTMFADSYESDSVPSNEIIVKNIKNLELYKSGDGFISTRIYENPTGVNILGKNKDATKNTFEIYYCYNIGSDVNHCNNNIFLVQLDSDLWVMKHNDSWRIMQE